MGSVLLRGTAMSQVVFFDWAKPFTISGLGTANAIVADPAGNTYVCGVFEGTVDMDPGPAGMIAFSAGGVDIYIVKLNPAGAVLWAKQIGNSSNDYCYSLVLDAAGNLYATGNFSSTVDFDPGPGVVTLTTSISSTFIIKFDPNGNLIWAKKGAESTSAGGVNIPSIRLTAAGNIYQCGSFAGTIDMDPGPGINSVSTTSAADRDGFVAKFDANGNYLWAGSFAGPLNISDVHIATDAAENVFISGSFMGTCDFDPGPGIYNLTSAGFFDVFACKLDANGNFSWANRIGNATTDNGYNIATDNSGNVVIVGSYANLCDFDPGPGTFMLRARNGPNGFILKLGNAGNFIWARHLNLVSVGGCFNRGLYIDGSGEIFTYGDFGGELDFDPSPAFVIHTATTSESYIARFTEDGYLIDAKEIGSSLGALVATDMSLDAAKNYYLSGYFIRSPDFDPTANSYYMDTPAPEPFGDGFALKLRYCRNITYDTLTVTTCELNYTLNNITYDTTGTYVQVLLNARGCDSLLRLYLTINPKQHTTIDTTICEGQPYFAGGSNQTTSGTYTDVLQTYLGCDSTVTTNLVINKKPKPDLGPDRGLCIGNHEVLAPGAFASYQWQNGTTAPTFPVNSTGLYWVTVKDFNDCVATDSLLVDAIIPLPANFLPPPDTVCQYEEVTLRPSGNYKTYTWSTNATTSSILATDPGIYSLTVTDNDGCVGKDTTEIIHTICPIAILLPSAFTPNGDLLNDVFKASVYGRLVSFKLEVYNRNGNLVFRTTDPGGGWDGQHKGIKVDTGVYVWQCNYQLAGSQPVHRKGTVAVIR
jgi:gliding motility-associated-like protein